MVDQGGFTTSEVTGDQRNRYCFKLFHKFFLHEALYHNEMVSVIQKTSDRNSFYKKEEIKPALSKKYQ